MSKAKIRGAKTPTSNTEQSSTPPPNTSSGSQSQPEPTGPTPMELAYAEWQQARAELWQADNNVTASPVSLDHDERLSSAMNRVDACEWKIIETCVKKGLDVRLRAMALQQVFLDAEMSGEPTDNRHQMMLSALIHDVLDGRFEWRAE
jgi:hypothetical protein